MFSLLLFFLGVVFGNTSIRNPCSRYSLNTHCEVSSGERKRYYGKHAFYRIRLPTDEPELHFDTCGSNTRMAMVILDHNYQVIKITPDGCRNGRGLSIRNMKAYRSTQRTGRFTYLVGVAPMNRRYGTYTLNMYNGFLNCGQSKIGHLARSRREYYKVYFARGADTRQLVNVDTCGSSFDTSLWLNNYRQEIIRTCHDDNCMGHDAETRALLQETPCADSKSADIGFERPPTTATEQRNWRREDGMYSTTWIAIGGYTTSAGAYKLHMKCVNWPETTTSTTTTTTTTTEEPTTTTTTTEEPTTTTTTTTTEEPTTTTTTTEEPTTTTTTTEEPTTTTTTTEEPTTTTTTTTTEEPTTTTTTTTTTRTTTPEPTTTPTCGRVRKPWHRLSTADKQLYIDAFVELYKRGRLTPLSEAHNTGFSGQPHGTSAFLPWHRYFLYEFETQLRALGGRFRCISVPYWDVAYENEVNPNRCDVLEGPMGGGAHRGCLTGTRLAEVMAPVSSGRGSNACLIHAACSQNGNEACYFADRQTIRTAVFSQARYGNDVPANNGFRYEIETNLDGLHDASHVNVGGDMASGQSPQHPAFWLLHNYIDYLWASWQNCHGFDRAWNGNTAMYEGGHTGGVKGRTKRTDTLRWFDLEQSSYSWYFSTSKGKNVKIEDTFDISKLGEGVKFHVSHEMWTPTTFSASCNRRTLNPAWFELNQATLQPLVHEEIEMVEEVEVVPMGGYSSSRRSRRRRRRRKQSKSEIVQMRRNILRNMRRKRKMRIDEHHAAAVMMCKYRQNLLGQVCNRPENMRNCDDLRKNKYEDIDVTLEELLHRAGNSRCVKQTRRKYFTYCKRKHKLLALCNGAMDNFCDKPHHEPHDDDRCPSRPTHSEPNAHNHAHLQAAFSGVGTSVNTDLVNSPASYYWSMVSAAVITIAGIMLAVWALCKYRCRSIKRFQPQFFETSEYQAL